MSLYEQILGRHPAPLPTGHTRSIRSGRPAGQPDPAATPSENNRITQQRENRQKVLLAIAAGGEKAAALCHSTDLCRSSIFNLTRGLESEGLIVITASRWAHTYRLTEAGQKTAVTLQSDPTTHLPTTRSIP